jgi:hypothetical protein
MAHSKSGRTAETRATESTRTVHRRGRAWRRAAIAAVTIATLSIGALPRASASVPAAPKTACDLLSKSEALPFPTDHEPSGDEHSCLWIIPAAGSVPERVVDLTLDAGSAVADYLQEDLSGEGFAPIEGEADAFFRSAVITTQLPDATITKTSVTFIGFTEDLFGVVRLSVDYDDSTAPAPRADEDAVVKLGLQARDRFKPASPFAKAPKGSKVLFDELLAEPADAVQPFSGESSTGAYESGGFTVTLEDPNANAQVIPDFRANGPNLTNNVRIEVTMSHAKNVVVGLVCRYGDTQAYGFAISRATSGNNGDFVVGKRSERGGDSVLAHGSVPYAAGGGDDHLVVDCRGPKKPSKDDRVSANFTINGKGHKVVDKKSPLGNGAVGLLVEVLDPGRSSAQATFTNLRVTKLPE